MDGLISGSRQRAETRAPSCWQRQTEEYLVINASGALLEHIGEIRARLADPGLGSNRR